MTTIRKIYIPISIDSLIRLNYDIAKDDELIEIIIGESEFDSLFKTGVFKKINQQLNILIDDYEDELIFYSQLEVFGKILDEFILDNPDNTALQKLRLIYQFAYDIKTGLCLNFTPTCIETK